MSLPTHGSNPVYLYEAFSIDEPKSTTDFSVNVNPFGVPETIRNEWQHLIQYIEDYPDPNCTKLKHAIKNKEQLSKNNILIGNGATELIFLLANVFRGQDVLVVDPTFSEYRTACEAFHCRVYSFQLHEESDWTLHSEQLAKQLHGKAALFICNPNNPTGVAYEKDNLLYVIRKASEQNVTVVIDEAFYDFCNDCESLLSAVNDFPNLVILRSFTKMFAIPGIRLGWLAANEHMIRKLTRFKTHWSVNAIAEEIGVLCLEEDRYVEQTNRWLTTERRRVIERLKELGFIVSNSSVNYYMLREREQDDVRRFIRYLLAEGIVPRHTENFIGIEGAYLRFAIRSKSENDKLINVLSNWSGR